MSADSYNALHFICDFRFGDSSFYFSNDNFTHSTKHIHCVRHSLCLLIQYIQSTRSKFSELRVMYDNCVRKMKMTEKKSISFICSLYMLEDRERQKNSWAVEMFRFWWFRHRLNGSRLIFAPYTFPFQFRMLNFRVLSAEAWNCD